MKDPNWITLDTAAIESIRSAVADTITQGEIMLRAGCPRKWFYRYAMGLSRRGFLDFNLVYGSLMHSLLEKLYRESSHCFTPKEEPVTIDMEMIFTAVKDSVLRPQDQAELDLTKAKVQIHFNAYRTHWHQRDAEMWIKGAEQVLEFDFHGLHLAGKVDLIAHPNKRDGVFIWDFKTAIQLDAKALDAWTFKFQFLFYCWLYWKVTGEKPMGMMINGLVKSHLRPRQVDRKTKQIESQETYLFRVKGDMAANREKYFYRQRIPLGKDALERFEGEILLPHINAFTTLQTQVTQSNMMTLLGSINALAMQMNTNHCHVYSSYCEYMNLCKDGWMARSEFDEREIKHIELTNE